MDRRQQATESQQLILTALIAALIGIGAQQNVAEGFANDYVKMHAIPAQHAVQQYVTDAVNLIASEVSDKVCQNTDNLEKLVKDYKHTFGKEPYLGLPIGEMSLLDQVKETQRQSKLLQKAISSRRPIPEEPTQEMGAGIPPPIFCTGSNHCAIASMLSLISFVCMLLGYTGNAPPRSFSIHLGDLFKSALRIQKNRCIVIEDIFANLSVFLQLLREQYPPYAPFLDCIFSLFSSKTFSKNTNGTCSLHEGSKEVLSSLKMLEESTESLGDRLQHELLSCGSEQFHSHLQMKPGVISAFGLPCAGLDIDLSTGVVRGLLSQIPFTAESMASFQLFGKTVGSGLQFHIASNLFAAICDTRGRNQNFGAEDAQNVGTSHYYLLIRTDDNRYFFVDSTRTNVQEISQEDFLQNVNDNGIVIFMRNRVEQEVPQQVAKIASQSHPSVRKHSAGGGAAAVSAQPAPSSKKPSADSAAVSCPHPQQKSSAGGGTPTVPHQSSSSFGHAQPTRHPTQYDGSRISDLNCNDAFYTAVVNLIPKSAPYPESFLVDNLTLVWNDLQNACENGVWVSGSFGFFDRDVKHLFRAVGFQFDDGTVVNYTGTAASLSDGENKTKFVDRVNNKWKSSMITCITFAKCN